MNEICTPIPHFIAVTCLLPEDRDKAGKLAGRLNLPLVSSTNNADLLLVHTGEHLELRSPSGKLLTGAVRAEFVHGATGYRRKFGGEEMLVRATGHKKNRQTTVLDATGGLGRDSFILASHGCNVHIFERNPVVGALLDDGLRRALAHPETMETAEKIHLHIEDSCLFMKESPPSGQFDVVYIDPMFPERHKAAQVKKELQMLQVLIGHDVDIDQLFSLALRTANKRIVVKRPTSSPSLPGPAPSHSVTGKTIRFDVYVK